MSDRLPPLTALRAFDAAARHMSFRDAAAELNVTPAALSFQIKQLEEHYGAPLFNRLNRRITLTEAGQALAPGTANAFAALSEAWRAARRVRESGMLTVTAGPAITARWLAPRLFAFARDHPEVELRFAATLRILDFARDDIDVAIRFGLPGPEEAKLHKAMDIREWVTPMMTPALARDYPTPDALRDAPLIHQDDTAWMRPPADWPAWFRANGVTPPAMHGPHFSQADHAMDAAQAGAGVVLGRGSLADLALRQGALVAPFSIALVPNAHFRVLCPEGAQARPEVRAFLDWLAEQVAAMPDHAADHDLIDAADVPAP
ncbi:transcriptional regulator GcvA [Jannaschia sp. LMIT008]|uniref:transcriptional regulator GcvA n=1 Tax=Jannaschia maritima TaxID=3032585 RepID=UPI002810C23C|nr:transcriptional regulator GcvA [Jannaschia sp. LMIT008]